MLGLALGGNDVERVVTLTLHLYARPLSVALIQEVRGAVRGVLGAIDRESMCSNGGTD